MQAYRKIYPCRTEYFICKCIPNLEIFEDLLPYSIHKIASSRHCKVIGSMLPRTSWNSESIPVLMHVDAVPVCKQQGSRGVTDARGPRSLARHHRKKGLLDLFLFATSTLVYF